MPRGVRDQSRVNRQRIIVGRVLARSRRKGWDELKTAEVIVASLSPARVWAGVVGPCFYCGDDLAATVDHIEPLAGGGADDRANVVSCCSRCNTLKHTMPVSHFLRLYPFGCDEARNRRLRSLDSPEYVALAAQHQRWLGTRRRVVPDDDKVRWILPRIVDWPA